MACLILLLLAAGCATETGSRDQEQYGLRVEDRRQALERGEGRQALGSYEREAAELERRGQRVEAAEAHRAVAGMALRLGQYQKAIRSGLRALALMKDSQSPEVLGHRTQVHALVGQAYLHARDLKEARRRFQEGLELSRSIPSARGGLLWSATFSNRLGQVALAEGDYRSALQHGLEGERTLDRLTSRAQSRRLRLPRRVQHQILWSLSVIGRAHEALGDFDQAESALRRAVKTARDAGGQYDHARAAVDLARLLLRRGDSSQALAQFREALPLATRLGAVSILTHLHAGMGGAHAAQGQYGEALSAFRRALDLVEDVRGQFSGAELRSAFVEDKQRMYQGAVRAALAAGQPDEAFGYAERGRARAFLDLLGTQTMLSKGKTRSLVEEELRLREQVSEAQAAAEEETDPDDPPPGRGQLAAAEQAYRAFLERVQKASGEQASLMTVQPVTLEEVRGLLPEGTTLLEYLVTERETVLWVVDRERVQVLRLRVSRATLVEEVGRFRAGIAEGTPLEEVKTRGRDLHERLVGPARPHLRGDRLLIVPHDVLHYLPFGALRTPEGRWLLEEYTLATLPSASVLKFLGEKGAESRGGALVVGNPDLGSRLALPYAEREAQAVAASHPGATLLVRQQATEAKAKAMVGEAGLVHFATHGELDQEDPLASALLLVPGAAEDGRLTVRELFGLDLHARLVVLSACETGLGKLSRGDELVGLQRAFLYAGTPAVVTTLWKVDDRATYEVMRVFYGQLEDRGAAEALRHAQRTAMTDFPHPFFWAPFTLTGTPR